MSKNPHMEESELRPLAISRVGFNGAMPFIYLSKEVVKRTGLGKGARVLISLDRKGRLVVERIDDADKQTTKEDPK